jgi:uncharacterized membrane protein YwzB
MQDSFTFVREPYIHCVCYAVQLSFLFKFIKNNKNLPAVLILEVVTLEMQIEITNFCCIIFSHLCTASVLK